MADADKRKIRVKITRQENADYFRVQVWDVVEIPFGEYLGGVVASEIGNSNLEACKAQAVAARTFAVLKGVLDGKTITDSSSTDQAYRAKRCDSAAYPHALFGVAVTDGQILTYNGRPISAVYSACNGGRTVSAKERWGSERAYLPAQDDPWDDSSKRTGHGVGMSQRGAKAMAKAGKTYLDILSFYYPGTSIETLQTDEPEETHMVNVDEFLRNVMIPFREGWGYIYGTWGQVWTKEDQEKLNQTSDSNRARSRQYGSQWIGKRVTDCSGLIRRAMYWCGEEVAHHATYLYTDYCKVKGRYTGAEVLKPGTLMFKKGSREKIHHVGVYIGDGVVVEAKGAQYGVVQSSVSDGWDYWGELKAVDYTNSTVKEESHMVTATVVNVISGALNMRNGPGKGNSVLCKIPRGETVEVLDTSNSKWYKIKYGGRTGWASVDYLKLTEQAAAQPAPVYADIPTPQPSFNELCAGIRETLQQLTEQIVELEAFIDQLK